MCKLNLLNFFLQAEAIMYQTDWRYTTDELYFKTYTPTAWSYLNQFYSASNSFVYIKDIDQKVDCDSTLMLDVFYNTVPETRYTFHGIVSTVKILNIGTCMSEQTV